MKHKVGTCALFVSIVVGVASQCAQAANLSVNCDRDGRINKAVRLLAVTNPQGPNSITVTGACQENIVIQSMDRLTLITKNGAAIADASSGSKDVIDILDSQRITIKGFTINGGLFGILCSSGSLCRFSGNTIEGGAAGLLIEHSRAESTGNIMQNLNEGLVVRQGADVLSTGNTMQGNVDTGILVNAGGSLYGVGAIVRNNVDGVQVRNHSTLRMTGSAITGNGGVGVLLLEASGVFFDTGNDITGNLLSGVNVNDLSFAQFQLPDNKVVGNTGQPDVVCNPQFSGTRGALTNIGGGTTNCVEPARSSPREAMSP